MEKDLEKEVSSRIIKTETLSEKERDDLMKEMHKIMTNPPTKTGKQPTPQDPFADFDFGDD